MNSFVGIDFETANAKRISPCSVGLVKVVDNVVVDAFYSMIDPETTEWTEIAYSIHGILPAHVEGCPNFERVWNDSIAPFIDGTDFLVGHNVKSVEKSIINQCCDRYNMTRPDIEYRCSMQLAKKVYKLKPAGLENVCDAFGFDIIHHNALHDALASARLVTNFNKDREVNEKFGKYSLSDEENKIIDAHMFEIEKIDPPKKLMSYSQFSFLVEHEVDDDAIKGLDRGGATKMIGDIIDGDGERTGVCEFCGENFPKKSMNHYYCKASCRKDDDKRKKKLLRGVNDQKKDITIEDIRGLISEGCSESTICTMLKMHWTDFQKRFPEMEEDREKDREQSLLEHRGRRMKFKEIVGGNEAEELVHRQAMYEDNVAKDIACRKKMEADDEAEKADRLKKVRKIIADQKTKAKKSFVYDRYSINDAEIVDIDPIKEEFRMQQQHMDSIRDEIKVYKKNNFYSPQEYNDDEIDIF